MVLTQLLCDVLYEEQTGNKQNKTKQNENKTRNEKSTIIFTEYAYIFDINLNYFKILIR